MDEARQVRQFWFGALPMSAQELQRREQLWFAAGPPELRRQCDELIGARFAGMIERAARGELASWADSPRRRLSLLILLDQFPRNIYRGTARSIRSSASSSTCRCSMRKSARYRMNRLPPIAGS